MSELGSSAAVGIESVEWLDAGGGQLTVRVTGRWRRRRGWVESRGQTMLVIEADGRRQRFPATPEPPSLTGAAPGTWRLSFAVPAELAHGLRGHVWLALGTVTVPLPVPESAAGPAVEPGAGAGGAGGAERGVPRGGETVPPPAAPAESPRTETASEVPERDPAGLEIERAWRRADAAERAADELGERVSALERALERERAERARQVARLDPLGPAGAEQARLRAEGALRAARRGGDVRVPSEPPLPPAASGGGGRPARAEASQPSGDGVAEERPVHERETVAALRRELDSRVAAEAVLRARTVQAETRLAARVLLEQRTAETLAELRTELEQLRDTLERERTQRRTAEEAVERMRAELGGQRERSREAHTAIAELRTALEGLHPAPETPAPAGPAEAVTPDRLSEALTRLRQNAEPRDGAQNAEAGERAQNAEAGEAAASDSAAGAAEVPQGEAVAPAALAVPFRAVPAAPGGAAVPATAVGGPTVETAFRRLLARDPERAGRLVVGLLGAQRAAWPQPIAYDLVLGPGYGTVQVTADERGVAIVRSAAARAREQVGVQLLGDPGRLARLLGAGRLRALLRFGLARVRGHREGLAALRALLTLPLDLGALRAAGTGPEGETLFTLLAAMIDPAWTRGELFALGFTDERGHTVHLQIRDGAPPLVSLEPPAGRVATRLSGSAEGLWRAFADADAEAAAGAGIAVDGDRGPLTLVRMWANRAQSGHSAR